MDSAQFAWLDIGHAVSESLPRIDIGHSLTARMWHRLLVVGWGCAFYAVDLDERTYSRHAVDTYFGSIAVGTDFGHGDDFLLVACGERVTRINEDGSPTWDSDVVGIDGVIINDVVDGVISGSGEWDPPDGWEPFRLRLSDGGRA